MTRPVRLIPDLGSRDPRRNLALDEALAREAGPEPVVRLWRNGPCVVVGRFQVAAAEVDATSAERLGVPVYRRFTGGGAVYHDPGNLNVSLVAPRAGLTDGTWGAATRGLYGAVLEPLAAAVLRLGVAVATAPRGLFAGSYKLGGVAAWIGGRSVLVHATLLVDADLATLRQVLAGPGDPDNPRWRLTRSEPSPVTSIAEQLGGSVDGPELHRRVAEAVARAFGFGSVATAPHPGESDGLRPSELAAAAALFSSRYADPAWHATGALTERG